MSRDQGTPTGSGTKATFSCWFKLGTIDTSDQGLLRINDSGVNSMFAVYISPSAIKFRILDSAAYVGTKVTSRQFFDHSAFYHVVCTLDTTQSTATDRMKVYVNGVLETDFSTNTAPDEDHVSVTLAATSGSIQLLNSHSATGGSAGTDCYMAEVCFCDGQALAASSFGEFDEDSPTIWKPKDVSGLTFGDEGWYCDFEDSDNLGDDESGNENDLTEYNLAAADQATDTPTNNFCTLNSLHKTSQKTFTQGNTTYAKSGSWHRATLGTIAPTNGKWYFEFKNNNDAKFEVAVCNETLASNGLYFSDTTANSTYTFRYSNHAITFYTANGSAYMYQNGSSTRSDVGQIASGDIGMIAFDCTTGKLWTGREGTWDNSGDPAAGSNPSTTWSTNFTANQTTYFGFGQESDQVVDVNFGGVAGFGGAAVSSANADGNGYGAFEFAVPSGFYALCTQNLAEEG